MSAQDKASTVRSPFPMLSYFSWQLSQSADSLGSASLEHLPEPEPHVVENEPVSHTSNTSNTCLCRECDTIRHSYVQTGTEDDNSDVNSLEDDNGNVNSLEDFDEQNLPYEAFDMTQDTIDEIEATPGRPILGDKDVSTSDVPMDPPASEYRQQNPFGSLDIAARRIHLPAPEDGDAKDAAGNSEEAPASQLKPSPPNIMTDPQVYITAVRTGDRFIVVTKGRCVGIFECP